MSSFWDTVGIIILILAFILVLAETVRTLIGFLKDDD
jgi:hypothetical protein